MRVTAPVPHVAEHEPHEPVLHRYGGGDDDRDGDDDNDDDVDGLLSGDSAGESDGRGVGDTVTVPDQEGDWLDDFHGDAVGEQEADNVVLAEWDNDIGAPLPVVGVALIVTVGGAAIELVADGEADIDDLKLTLVVTSADATTDNVRVPEPASTIMQTSRHQLHEAASVTSGTSESPTMDDAANDPNGVIDVLSDSEVVLLLVDDADVDGVVDTDSVVGVDDDVSDDSGNAGTHDELPGVDT